MASTVSSKSYSAYLRLALAVSKTFSFSLMALVVLIMVALVSAISYYKS